MRRPATMPTLLAAILATALAALASGAHAELRRLHFSHQDSADSPRGRSAEYLAQLVNERFPGRLELIVHPDGTLFDDATAIRELRFDTGLMNAPDQPGGRTPERALNGLMTAVDIADAAAWARPLTVFELPYAFADLDAVHRLVDGARFAALVAPLPRTGLRALGIWDGGMRQIAMRDATVAAQPPMLAGRNLGNATTPVARAVAEALGAHPAPFDAADNSAWQGTWWEIAQHLRDRPALHITTTGHAYHGFVVLIGNDFWEAMPADLQAGLQQAVRDATVANRRYAAVAEARAREELTAALGGANVHLLKNPAAWRQQTAGIAGHFRRRVGDRLFDQVFPAAPAAPSATRSPSPP